jgi:Tol biopolymer transport system component
MLRPAATSPLLTAVTKRLVALAAAAGMTCLGVVAGIGASAQALVPAPSGRIVFTRAICDSDSLPCWEIVTANPDDSNEIVVAGPYPRRVWDDHFIANWAPDGRSVIFMARQKIWQVNADGTGLHKVWTPPNDGTGMDDGPTFTPDGEHIVFTRCCPHPTGYALWMIDADGTSLHRITQEVEPPGVDGPSDNLPQVSPDGKAIVYHRNVVTCSDPSECGNRIVTVTIHGGHRVELTDPALEAQIPYWSPDSTKIVFTIFPPDGPGIANIAIINADGSGFRQLTFATGERGNVSGSFSPDGSKIIFYRAFANGNRDLFTMDADGSNVQRLTRTAALERWPSWIAAP